MTRVEGQDQDHTMSRVRDYQDISMNSRLLNRGEAETTHDLKRDASIRNESNDYNIDREELLLHEGEGRARGNNDDESIRRRAAASRKKATAQSNKTMIVVHKKPSQQQMKKLLAQRKAKKEEIQNLGPSDQSFQSMRERARRAYGSNRRGGTSKTVIHDSLNESPVSKGKVAM